MIPFSLSELALSAFGKYVMDATTKFINMYEETSPAASRSQDLHEFCKKIDEIINSTVPSCLANQISKILQNHVLGTYNERNSWFQVAQHMLLAVLHIHTTEYSFIWRCPDSNMVRFSETFLDKALIKFKCLKSLTLEMMLNAQKITFNAFYRHKELEELTLMSCSNITVVLYSRTTENLTKLNLRGTDVDNTIIPCILKYKDLKYLDLMGTLIQDKGITTILEELSKFNSLEGTSGLEVFKCDLVPSQIVLVGNLFPNLTCLDIFVRDGVNLLPLRELKKLVSLTVGIHKLGFIWHGFRRMLSDLLGEIGHQLLKLHVRNIREIDINLINERCPSLQNFGIRDAGQYRSLIYMGHDDNHSQVCPSVKHLEIVIGYTSEQYMQNLLSRFVNIEELELNLSQTKTDHPLFTDILERMLAKKLKVLYLTMAKILFSGKTLIVCRNDGTFSHENVENFKQVLQEIKEQEMPMF